jgi:uncharacterized protein with GYD domain
MPLGQFPGSCGRGYQHREIPMAKYLFEACYTGDGVKGLVREGGTARRAVVEKACASAGGKLERCILLSVAWMLT